METTEVRPIEPETFGAMVSKALAVYGPVDVKIAELRSMALNVPALLGVEDKAGYALAQEVRMACVRTRANVEKTRKTLKADALEFGRKVDGAAAKWAEQIESIEAPIEAQQKAVDAEKAARVREAAEAAAKAAKAKLDARVEAVLQYGPLGVQVSVIEAMTDEQFAAALEATRQQFEQGKAERAELERLRAAQAAAEALERKAKEDAEREARKADDERRAEERRVQTEREKVQRAEQDRLNAERQQLDRERAELEAEKSKKARAKAAKEAAAAEAARLEALKPDVVKIDGYVAALRAIEIPEVWCSPEIGGLRADFVDALLQLIVSK